MKKILVQLAFNPFLTAFPKPEAQVLGTRSVTSALWSLDNIEFLFFTAGKLRYQPLLAKLHTKESLFLQIFFFTWSIL